MDDEGVAFGIHQVILRVWDAGTDMIPGTMDDNFNETWANVRVENKLPPVPICPPDVTICCGWDETDLSKTGEAFANGICAPDSVDYSDAYIGFDDVCNEGTIRRTWSVIDGDNSCQQFITVEWGSNWDPTWPNGGPLAQGPYFNDCIDPTLPYGPNTIDWPNDDEIDCDDYETEYPTWLASNCDLIGWNLNTDTFLFEEGACMKIFNYWTIIDWCVEDRYEGYGIFEQTQILKFYDTEKPEVFAGDKCIAADQDGCVGEATLTAAACDTLSDCMSEWIKWQIFVDVWGDWNYDYVFSSYAPRFDPNFGTPVNELYVEPTASCEEVSITLPELIEGSKYEHRILWKANDGCGNITSFTSYFTVEDKKAPTPYCINVSTAVMQTNGEVELWACDFDLGSFDNCSSYSYLRWSFGDEIMDYPGEENPRYDPDSRCTSMAFDCGDIIDGGPTTLQIPIYVWDECDNYDFCIVELTLADNFDNCGGTEEGESRIAGNISTEQGVNVDEVAVTIASNQPEYPMTIMTDADGMYITDDIHNDGQDYSITSSRDIDYLNGVSTIDIVMIQRHILGLGDLDSPYKMIAADVNNDENISAADLTDIRKLILGVNADFPSNESWRFAEASQQLTIDNPYAFNEQLNIIALNGDRMDENFIAQKIGDVTGDVILGANEELDTRNASTLNFIIEDASVVAGDKITVDFTSNNFDNISGYQFTLNTAGLTVVDVVSGAIEMTEANVAVLNASTTTMSWNSAQAVSVEDAVLFSITFEATQATSVLNGLNVSSRITKAEAYGTNMELMNVSLGDVSTSYALYQNEPNPFDNNTAISFVMAEAGNASLTVYDVTGQVIISVKDSYTKGMNTVTLTKADLGATGVMYYTFESGDFTATKKMIVIE